MGTNIHDAVVLITSRLDKKDEFGTGFVVLRQGGYAYVVTCAHVITDVGGADQVMVSHLPAEVAYSGMNDGLDLAILLVANPIDGPVIRPVRGAVTAIAVTIVGFYSLEPSHVLSQLRARIGPPDELETGGPAGRVKVWQVDLLEANASLQPGFSGSPVIDERTQEVFGIITHRRGERKGVAIAVEALKKLRPDFWPTLTELINAPLIPAGRPVDMLPAITNLRFRQNRDFVGREEDLKQLYRKLEGDLRVQGVPVGITGMGGIGKTQLVIEYVYRHVALYPDGVLWIDGGQSPEYALAELGRWLKDHVSDSNFPMRLGQDRSNPSLDALTEVLSEYLRNRPHSLLIIDNLDDPAILDRPVSGNLIPADLPCRILFTTRRQDPLRFPLVRLGGLGENESLRLLLRYESRQPILDTLHPDHDVARSICKIFAGLPLALEIAGAHLGRNPLLPLGAYRAELLNRGALSVLDERLGRVQATHLGTGHEAVIEATLATQWARLQMGEARQVLQVAALLEERGNIPIARLSLLSGLSDRPDSFFGSTLTMAIQELQDASLLEELRHDLVRIHPLVREFAGKQTPPERMQEFREQCALNLVAAFEDIGTLERICRQRGIDQVQEDLMVALKLLHHEASEGNQDLFTRIRTILRMLRREAHHFRNWDPEHHPALFAQQIRIQALDMGLTHIANSARLRLEQIGDPYFEYVWRARAESPELEVTLVGHMDVVRGIALWPDGRFAISASADRSLKIWDLDTGQILRTLMAHTDTVWGVALALNGRRAVSASADGTLRIWDTQSGQVLRTLAGHDGGVLAVATTPNGRTIVSGSVDCTIRIWDGENGELLRVLTGHSDGVRAVAISADGGTILSGSKPGELKVWNLSSEREKNVRLEGHSGMIYSLAITGNGRRAASAAADGTVRLWDLQTGREISRLVAHDMPVYGVTLTPDGARGASASYDRTVKVWNLETGEEERTLRGHGDLVYAVSITPDGQRIVSASNDRTLRVWDLQMPPDHQVVQGHESEIHRLAQARDGRTLVSASRDGTVRVWDADTGQNRATLKGHNDQVSVVAVSTQENLVVSGSDDATVRIWSLGDYRQKNVMHCHGRAISALLVTRDGRHAISGSVDSTLRVWDLEEGVEEYALSGHTGMIYDLAIMPDDQQVLSASADGKILRWNLTISGSTVLLGHHAGHVRSIAVTADGSYAVSGALDGTVNVWDLRQGNEYRTLYFDGNGIRKLTLSNDGRLIFAASVAGIASIWDLQDGELIAVLQGHSGTVFGLLAVNGGRHVISTGQDRTIRAWDPRSGLEVAATWLPGSVIASTLAADETTLFVGDGIGNVYCFRFKSQA